MQRRSNTFNALFENAEMGKLSSRFELTKISKTKCIFIEEMKTSYLPKKPIHFDIWFSLLDVLSW